MYLANVLFLEACPRREGYYPCLLYTSPEEDWESKFPVGADNKRNLAAKGHEEMGDIDKVLSECKYTVDEVYHTKANQQCMMAVSYTHLFLYNIHKDYGEKGVLIRK